jgi:hypothetical protein
MVSATNSQGFSNDLVNSFVDDIAFALTSLDALHRVPAVGGVNTPWLGLEMTPGVAPQTSPANRDEAAWVLRDRYYDAAVAYPNPANTGVAQTAIGTYVSLAPAGYIIRDQSFRIRSKIVDEIVKDIAFPPSAIVAGTTFPALPTAAQIKTLVVDIFNKNDLGISRSISSRPNPPTTLHWLDVSSAAVRVLVIKGSLEVIMKTCSIPGRCIARMLLRLGRFLLRLAV